MKQFREELLPEDETRLLGLWRQIPKSRKGRQTEPFSPLDRLRYLLACWMADWPGDRVFGWQPEVPWTKNASEWVIGKLNMRAQALRGYKTWTGMEYGFWVSGIRIGLPMIEELGRKPVRNVPDKFDEIAHRLWNKHVQTALLTSG